MDQQIKTINKPLTLNDDLKKLVQNQSKLNELSSEEETGSYDQITEKQLVKILSKINPVVKKNTNKLFATQISNQVAQQVIKLEQSYLTELNDKLTKVNGILTPLLLPTYETITNLSESAKLAHFNNLVTNLPLSKYLLVDNNEPEFDLLFKTYDTVRLNLIELNNQYQYNYKKILYLKDLDTKLKEFSDTHTAPSLSTQYDSDEEADENIEGTSGFSGSNLNLEMIRFKNLMKKLDYKLKNKNLREVIRNLN